MHIRATSVDLDGNIIAVGSMTYRPDDHGHFPAAANNQLALVRDQPDSLALAPCISMRDEATGFLRTEPLATRLWLPQAFARAILRALWLTPKEPLRIAIGNQDGSLTNVPRHEDGPRQLLSDWRFELREEGGAILVEVSAALRATLPIESKFQGNYWGTKGQPDRIVARFAIDPVTRIGCFGAYTGPQSEEVRQARILAARAERAPPISTSHDALNLESSPVGTGMQCAISGDRWVKVSEFLVGSRCIALSPDKPRRNPLTGFLEHGDYGWPRLWFYGIDMDAISEAMWQRPSTAISLAGDYIGYIQRDPGPERSSVVARINEINLAATLTVHGLALSYRIAATPVNNEPPPHPPWLKGELVLPWELLILRYPRFLRHRDKVRAAADLPVPLKE